ncbi:endopeptidase [Duck adenovirus 1]|uniref:Protease n=2 Tax=Duck atadenovirus A TaxID=130328 RepID=A0A7M4CJN3_9ADEN|nr:endopeptidase [Duck atadenovirus A]WKZ08003.1 endopeptidase [Duck adenovirus 1]
MSGTSESELKALMKSLGIAGNFLGTFDCTFPGFINKHKRQTAIINTGSRASGGLHWLAFAWDPLRYTIYMFDPLGWKEKDLFKLYGFSYKTMIKRSALQSDNRCVKLVKNTEAVQCTCAGSCGLFCVFFLYCFNLCHINPFEASIFQAMHGTSPALYPSKPHMLHANQQMLYDFLRSHSSYFVNNERTLVCNTKLNLINIHQ